MLMLDRKSVNLILHLIATENIKHSGRHPKIENRVKDQITFMSEEKLFSKFHILDLRLVCS